MKTLGMEKHKGYVFVPAGGPPVAVYARVLTALAVPVTVTADERQEAVEAAVRNKAPGLYRALVVVDPGGPVLPAPTGRRARWKVRVGRAVRGGASAEIEALTKREATERKGKPGAAKMRRVREARALVDLLRTHVLPRTMTGTVEGVAP